MIDLHSHILPNMDDGSQSTEETAELLKLLTEQGVTTLVATPHFYPHLDNPEDFLERRSASLANMPQVENSPELLLGAEVAYFSGLSCSEEMISLQLGNTGLLLIEMPFTPWSEHIIHEICEIPATLGLTPVLAHIDRYLANNQLPKHLNNLISCGVYLQCNADSFLSWRTRGKVLKLMKNGYIQFLGSDCHNLTSRKPQLGEAAKVIQKKLGEEFWEEFCDYAEKLLRLNNK
ncbi:MAG: hypothetical protein J6Q54_06295 [Oscillospiraceae bacterium]|nr:hypothetical protein [Oscillospiraceae bacterium]